MVIQLNPEVGIAASDSQATSQHMPKHSVDIITQARELSSQHTPA